MDYDIDETNVNEKHIDDFSIDYQLIKPYRSQVGKSSALRRFFVRGGNYRPATLLLCIGVCLLKNRSLNKFYIGGSADGKRRRFFCRFDTHGRFRISARF